MNKIFKVIYSKTRHCYVVVSELAKSHCKTTQSHTVRSKTALTAAVLLALGAFSFVGMPVVQADGTESLRNNDFVGANDQYWYYDEKKGEWTTYQYKLTSAFNNRARGKLPNYQGGGAKLPGAITAGLYAQAGQQTVTIGDRNAGQSKGSVFIGELDGYNGGGNNDPVGMRNNYVTAVGFQSNATGWGSIAIGSNAVAENTQETSQVVDYEGNAGTSGTVQDDNYGIKLKPSITWSSVALGYSAQAKDGNIAIGAYSDATDTSSATPYVSVGSSKLQRRITNVADGTGDTDVATVGQMNKAIESIGTTGWNLSTNGNSSSTTITSGKTVDFSPAVEGKNGTTDHKNVKISNDGSNVKIGLNKDIVLGEATEGEGGSLNVYSDSTEASNLGNRVSIDGSTVSVYYGSEEGASGTKRGVVLGVGEDYNNNAQGYIAFNNIDAKGTIGSTYLHSATDAPNDLKGRLVYSNAIDGTEYIANLDDGITFTGDVQKDVPKDYTQTPTKLNTTLNITGGAATEKDLTEGNIGVVSTPAAENADGTKTQASKLEIKLNKDLKGITSITSQTTDGTTTSGATITLGTNGTTISGGDVNVSTHKITGLKDGTADTDAATVGQMNTAIGDAKTKYYSVSVQEGRQIGGFSTNENNDGASALAGLAAGYETGTTGIASTVVGSYSGVIGSWLQGAAAVSVGTVNVNSNTDTSKIYSGVANSIVGQANMTTNSNAAIIYGAGNTVTDSYRPIDPTKAGAIFGSVSDPTKLSKAMQDAVKDSGGQVMVMGGGNNVESAYMSQVVGVGNTVKGNQVKNDKGEWATDTSTDTSNTAIQDYDPEKSSQYNYVDGFSNEVINGKHDYIIGANNKLDGDSYDDNNAKPIKRSNKSNVVIGDNHALTGKKNNVIIGSADTEGTLTRASDAVIIGHKANATSDTGADNAVAIGLSATAGGGNAVTIGVNTKAGDNSITIGSESSAISKNNIAIGRYAKVDGDNVTKAVALGWMAEAHVADGVAIGSNSIATVAGNSVEGYDPTGQTSTDTTATWQATNAAVSIGKADGTVTRQINGVAAGTNDTDAVNVAQIKKLASVDASNIGKNFKDGDVTTNENAWGEALGTGTVTKDNKQLVTGGTVYNEVRPSKDGAYVKMSQTTGDNLLKLDDQVKQNAQNISDNTYTQGDGILMDKTKKTISVNKGDGLKFTEDHKLAVNTGKHLSVNTDGQIDVGDNGAVAEHDGNLVTGDTVYKALNGGMTKMIIGTPGKDGKDGKDGTPGTIGLVGPAGTNGKDGAVDITIQKGEDGKDGTKGANSVDGTDGINRIVYEDKNGKHQVATMEDGLKFAGDDGQKDATKAIAKKLNNTVDIIGGADSTKLTANNIGVNNVDGKLKIQLVKDLTGITSISGSTDDKGAKITLDTTDKNISVNGGSIKDVATNLDKDGNIISGNENNAANMSDVSKLINNAADSSGKKLADKANIDASNIGTNLKGSDSKTAATTDEQNTNENAWGEAIGTGKLADPDASDKETNGSQQLVTGGTVYKALNGGMTKIVIGTPGENGKDGAPGTIGLVGPAGADGKNAEVDITIQQGKDDASDASKGVKGANGVDGKDGITRIVYKDAAGDHQVATMEDGLKFAGDDGQKDTNKVIAKKLNNTVDIIGGADNTKLTENNIGVNNVDGKLKVQLAQDLTVITSISNQTTTGDKTTGAKITLGTDGATTISGGDVSVSNNKITNIKAGEVKENSKDAVNGDQLYNEQKARTDADTAINTKIGTFDNSKTYNYIDKTASISTNLTTLDTHVKKNAEDISQINTRIDTLDGNAVKYDDSTKSKITLAGSDGTTIDQVKDGTISSTSKEAVNGGQLNTEQQTRIAADKAITDKIGSLEKDGNYIKKDATISQNLNKLDTQVKDNSDKIAQNTKDISEIKTNVRDLTDNAVQYDNDSKKSKITLAGEKGTTITNVKDGSVGKDSKDAVNGGQLFDEKTARENADTEIKTDITKIKDGEGFTDKGKTVIKSLAQDAVDVKGSDYVTVTNETKDGTKTFTVSVDGNGKVASGDKGLISGDTIYNELRPSADGSYIKQTNTTAQNLVSLDTQVKKTSDLINSDGKTIKIGGSDAATKIDVNGKDGKGRVITGVVSDANDPNSAANVGYVNGLTAANTQQIYRDMNNAYSRLDTNINRAAAGSNALAALHPLDFDPADKASFAVGYGHYRNANAAAVGAFYQPNANTMVNMGISLGNGDPGFNAGVSFKIGKGSAYNGVSKAEMAQTIHDQATEISAIKADDAAKDKRIDALEKENQEMKKQIQEILARLNG